jgi:broad-specificity NMP kinase
MKIIIAGTDGEGKSAIARLIVEALAKEGITIDEIKDAEYNTLTEFHDNRLESLKKDLHIVVETLRTEPIGLSGPSNKRSTNHSHQFYAKNR